MPDDPPVEFVSMSTLRAMFNNGEFWHRAMYGDLFQTIEVSGHPSPPRSDDPVCTCSQIVAYRDDDARERARVHQYLRPDGSLGGSSRMPDPQWLIADDGVLYFGIAAPDAEG